MRPYVILILSVLAILLTSCRIPQPVKNTGGIEYMTIEIWASTDLAQIGQTVKFRATLTNTGTATHLVDLGDRPVLDIVVRAGNKITRWSDGKQLIPEMTRLDLKPSESKSIEMDYPVSNCCESLHAAATFVYSERLTSFLVPPEVIVFVGSYPYGAFP